MTDSCAISAMALDDGDLLSYFHRQSPVVIHFKPEPHKKEEFGQFIAVAGRNSMTTGFRRV